MRAAGTFTITKNAQPPYDSGEGVLLGRVSITKRFVGELEGSSSVEMLNALTPVKGSAGYVALERVFGTLHSRVGSFVLQHSGTMNRGQPALSVTVVPDSGTAGLKGIAGAMTIEIVDGQHFYAFEYTLDAAV
ncbi:MAG TPA: DUF3224 domain-containing protein [Polyangia bacterium]|jgi:hypothetical protein|nr:DUF3224 domain-containing protein [Polyangia bacterium]